MAVCRAHSVLPSAFCSPDDSFHVSFYRTNFSGILFLHSTDPETGSSIYEGVYKRHGAMQPSPAAVTLPVSLTPTVSSFTFLPLILN